MKTVFKGFFTELEKETIARLKEQHGKAYEHIIPNIPEAQAKLAKKYDPVAIALTQDQGQYAMNLVGQDEAFIITDQIQKKISDRIPKWAPDTLQELNSDLIIQLTEGFALGETVVQLTDRITNTFDGYEGYRSERLARTETIWASNGAANEAYHQSAYVTGKEWFANPDACESCQELDGTVVGLDDDYAKMGTTVGTTNINFEDIGHPPLHPNCECTLLPTTITVDNVNT